MKLNVIESNCNRSEVYCFFRSNRNRVMNVYIRTGLGFQLEKPRHVSTSLSVLV